MFYYILFKQMDQIVNNFFSIVRDFRIDLIFKYFFGIFNEGLNIFKRYIYLIIYVFKGKFLEMD